LRPRAAHIASVSRLRSQLVSGFHEFFSSEGFYYTNPPILTRSDAEGAGESFQVTSKDKDFFGLGVKAPRLTVSTQLHLEALMMGLGRVWTLSPTFRAEKSITSRHLAEFWMLEVEWGLDELEDLMSLVEKLIQFVVGKLRQSNILQELTETIKDQDNTVPVDDILSRWDKLASKEWTRMNYQDAVDILIEQHNREPFDITPVQGSSLQSSHEQFLASKSSTPVFITHYPTDIKPFYMLKSSDNPAFVENFDLLVPGMGEIAGGSLRIHDLVELGNSMQHNMMDETELEWYKDLRRWGSIPHGGFGLGFDRLLGYMAGITNLREVVAFPRMFGKSGCMN
jgi:asparaginyl-tRNA synthetase